MARRPLPLSKANPSRPSGLSSAPRAAAQRPWSRNWPLPRTRSSSKRTASRLRPIAKALVDAHKRGVKVEVILDKSQTDGEVQFRRFRSSRGHSDQDRCRPRDRPQQDHDRGRADRHHGQLQFHQERRGEQRREPPGDPLARNSRRSTPPTGRPTQPTPKSTRARKRATRKPIVRNRAVNPAAAVVSKGYVASKNSAVFHKAGCASAAKISEKNLVRYNTRDEAIQAGKKPCAECNP